MKVEPRLKEDGEVWFRLYAESDLERNLLARFSQVAMCNRGRLAVLGETFNGGAAHIGPDNISIGLSLQAESKAKKR